MIICKTFSNIMIIHVSKTFSNIHVVNIEILLIRTGFYSLLIVQSPCFLKAFMNSQLYVRTFIHVHRLVQIDVCVHLQVYRYV